MIGRSIAWFDRKKKYQNFCFALYSKSSRDYKKITIESSHIDIAKQKAEMLHPGYKICRVISQLQTK